MPSGQMGNEALGSFQRIDRARQNLKKSEEKKCVSEIRKCGVELRLRTYVQKSAVIRRAAFRSEYLSNHTVGSQGHDLSGCVW